MKKANQKRSNLNYKKIYEDLIHKSISENRKKGSNVYYESHHIVPKCLGGNNSKENLVLLTSKEHFIAHKLLIKIYPDSIGLIHAFHFISTKLGNKISSRDYEYAKLLKSNIMSTNNPSTDPVVANKISLSNLGKKRSLESIEKYRICGFKREFSEETKNQIIQIGKILG